MAEVEKEYVQKMQELARFLDFSFNEEVGHKTRAVGFCLLIFRFDEAKRGRMNYISNADRKDMIAALKELIAQMEGRVIETSTKQ